MKHIHKVLSCSCVLLLSLQTPALCDFTHSPGKSSVIVLQGEVTVDGQQRPDLGRSFADTITGGLLKTRAYSVIDHLGNQPLAQAIESSVHLAPELSAVSTGKATGARWIFVPRMIVEGEFHKLTMKKIRVSDGQTVDVFETHASGNRETMFLLVGDALRYLYTQTARDPARLGKTPTGEPLPIIPPSPAVLDPTPIAGSYAPIPTRQATAPAAVKPRQEAVETEVASADHTRVPEGLKLEGGTHVQADAAPTGPAAKPDKPEIQDPATELENKLARYAGTISTVNPEWRFCILKMRTSDTLHIGDELSVRTGTIVPDETTLKVTKIEGRQAVADLVDKADLETLKVGQKFYQWAPR